MTVVLVVLVWEGGRAEFETGGLSLAFETRLDAVIDLVVVYSS